MEFIWAGLLAAASAYTVNRLGIRLTGAEGIIFFVPLVEEVAKTFSAYYLNASILLTHLVFGIVEAVYDLSTSPKKGLTAGLVSIVGHSLFGSATILAYFSSNNILLGLIAGLIIHVVWNGVVMKYLVR